MSCHRRVDLKSKNYKQIIIHVPITGFMADEVILTLTLLESN